MNNQAKVQVNNVYGWGVVSDGRAQVAYSIEAKQFVTESLSKMF